MNYIVRNFKFILIILTLVGGLLRFYNLNWGSPYYFHPDERNIASSISQLKFPGQMNPNFFAYGSLPIYAVYFTGLILNFLSSPQIFISQSVENFQLPFDQAIIISRFFSAFFSTIIILLIYQIGEKIHSKAVGLLAAFFTTTSVGLIQFSHFGTFEIWITFFCLLLFYVSVKAIHHFDTKKMLFAGLALGSLISIKISNIVLIILPILNLMIKTKKTSLEKSKFELTKTVLRKITYIILIIGAAMLFFLITNPFTFLDFSSFKSSMDYESKVALGEIDVFYTHEFFDTTPILFQFMRVYPFLLNPPLTIIFIPSFFYILWITLKARNKLYLLLTTYYLLLFLSQAFLFVKWTRYLVPTLPFVYLIIAIATISFGGKFSKISSIKYQALRILGLFCIIFTLSYYQTVLKKPDTRIEAAVWAKNKLPSNSKIVSESYDLGIITFNPHFSNIALCDIYHLEKNDYPCNGFSLPETLSETDYIILPSERIMKMALLKKSRFPKRYSLYASFFDSSQYKLIYKTPCDIFCKIIYINDSMLSFEQTANVFDRPTVYILKKI